MKAVCNWIFSASPAALYTPLHLNYAAFGSLGRACGNSPASVNICQLQHRLLYLNLDSRVVSQSVRVAVITLSLVLPIAVRL